MSDPDTAQAAAPFKGPFEMLEWFPHYYVRDANHRNVATKLTKQEAQDLIARLNQPTPPEQGERESFEKWAAEKQPTWGLLRCAASSGFCDYVDARADAGWAAWQARAAAPASPGLTEDDLADIRSARADIGAFSSDRANDHISDLLAIIARLDPDSRK